VPYADALAGTGALRADGGTGAAAALILPASLPWSAVRMAGRTEGGVAGAPTGALETDAEGRGGVAAAGPGRS